MSLPITMTKRALYLLALLQATANSQAGTGGVGVSVTYEEDDSETTVVATTTPTEPCFNIEIGLIFDQYPDETKWEITKGRRNTIEHANANVIKESPYYDPAPPQGYSEASETHIVCLPEGKYSFTIIDSNLDGMCCGNGEGRYAVTYQDTGEIIGTGSEFEQYESVTFQLPFVAPQLQDVDGDGVEDRTKNVLPPMIVTQNGLPEECKDEFGLHLETDDYGVETTWELREQSTTEKFQDGKVVASGGPYTSDFTYDLSYCLQPGKYTFVFFDWQCDGLIGKELNGHYELMINGAKVHIEGGTRMNRYWEEVHLEFSHESYSENMPIKIASVVESTATVAGESSGRMAKHSWVLAVTMMGVSALLWN